LPDQFRRVTAAQVQAAANKYLAPEKMKVIAVGDKAAVLPQLRNLGLGEPESRDADGQFAISRPSREP
jgi:zinc protease